MANLLVVDIQPAYRQCADDVASKTARFLEKYGTEYDRICIMSVNEELSGDTREDVEDYWNCAGLPLGFIDEHLYIEKPYAFLRGWMDTGVDDEHIVATLKALRDRNKWDSRDLDPELLAEIDEDLVDKADCLTRPYELEAHSPLFRSGEWEVCGGGRNECLKEMELWLESLGVTYSRREELVYG